jgi:hypothetical protein
MIRYPIRPKQLTDRIEQDCPGWLDRAAQRTEAFRQAGRYHETSSIWSKIKRTYMQLQGYKCGFCERALERSQWGSVEHDVEHFRPKAKVITWPSKAMRTRRDVDFPFSLGTDADPGYYLLAYHLENYLIACKTCNSALKANFFPIVADRHTDRDHPRNLTDEKAYLIYPIGAGDKNPEQLITFRGILPVPVATRGHARRRAQVTISFFELDRREILLQQRADIIVQLHLAITATDHPDPFIQTAATHTVARLTHPQSPHANCARAQHDLTLSDPTLARDFAHAAYHYLTSLS